MKWRPILVLFVLGLATSSAGAQGNLTPPGIRNVAATAGGGLTGGGYTPTVYLGLLTTCSSGQVLKWSGTAWACATAGAITGTLNHLVKIDSSGTAGVDSSTVDDGTIVTFVEPIQRTLDGAGTDQIVGLNSMLDPSTATWGIWSTEVSESSPSAYYDKVLLYGYNYNGNQVDPAQASSWMASESKFDDDGAGPDGYQTEWHFVNEGTDHVVHRWITHEAKWDGSEGSTSYEATRTTWLDWPGSSTPLMQLVSSSFQTNVPVTIHSDAAQPFSVVQLTGSMLPILTLSAIGGSSNLYTSLGVSSGSNNTPLVLSTTTALNVEMDAGSGKTAVFSLGTNGTFEIKNLATSNGNVNIFGDGDVLIADNTTQTPRLRVKSTGSRFYGNGRMGSGGVFSWTATDADGTPDTGITRAAANVAEIDNGTAGTLAVLRTADPSGSHDVVTLGYMNAHTGTGTTTGTGTANTTTKWTGTSALGNAWPLDDGTTWGVSSKFTITEATGAFVASGAGSIGGALNMNSHLINNVTDPSSAQDAATKAYVDAHAGSSISGLTTGTLPYATSSSTIADSIISQSGGNATIAGGVTVTGSEVLSGKQTTSTLGNNFALNAGTTTLVVDTGGITLTGLTGGTTGRVLRILYTGTSDIVTIANNSGSSSVGNKIWGQNFNVTYMTSGGGMELQYDVDHWRVLSTSTDQVQDFAVNNGLTVGGDLYVSGNFFQSNNHVQQWSSTTTPFGTPDLGISRNAAGVLEINNGTAGTLRDLKLRNLTATGTATIGPGGDSAGAASTAIYVTNAGTTCSEVRDSTNHVESENCASSSGGFVGTYTNHTFHIQTNSTNAIQIDTSQNTSFFGIVDYNHNLVDKGPAAALTSFGTATWAGGSSSGVLSSGSATSGVLTFGVAFANAPACSVSERSGSRSSYAISSITNAAITFSSLTASDTYDVVCIGH